MKKPVFALAAALAVAAVPAFAQSPRGEAKAMLAGKAVSIEYGRPSLKGRDMLAQAAVGTPWRMGADAATKLKTDADLTFGAAAVPKGEYVLTATKVAADTWHLNVKGADQKIVAEIPLTAEAVAQSIEMFTIELTGVGDKGEFKMIWGTTGLKTAFTGK
jgi:hypothetical protein